jgi:hypothetical protein
MFLRPHRREKDGKDHTYWSLVETVRTPDGPRQKTLCYLGELNSSAQTRWLRTIEGSPQELVNPGVFVGVLQNMGLEEGGLCTRTGD